MIAAVGAGVDFGRYNVARNLVANAADRAALAATSVDGQDRKAVVDRFFDLNTSDGFGERITIKSLTATPSGEDAAELAVEVSVTAELDSYFLQMIGIPKMEIRHVAKASRAVHNVEAVITIPSNGTMCATKERKPNTNSAIPGDTLVSLTPDPSCAHFNAMKEGARKFVEIMYGNDALSNVRIGLVPYNFKVRMPNLGRIPPSLAANEPANFYSNVTDAEPLSPVVSLTSDSAVAKAAINGLQQTPQGTAWVRTNLAAHVAGLMLDPRQSRFFSGDLPTAFDDAGTEKVLILMSDGINSGCCFTNWEPGNFDNQYVYLYEPDNREQIEICRVLKENGVRIFSILFDVDERDEGGEQINNIFARCASGAYSENGVNEQSDELLKCRHKQNCYNAANDEELIKTYVDIAKTFYIPNMTK